MPVNRPHAAHATVALLLALAASAQGATLAQVFSEAQLHNPQLRAAAADYRAAQARVPRARSALLPHVDAQASLADNTQNDAANPLLSKFQFPTDWSWISRDVALTATTAIWHPADSIGVRRARLGVELASLNLARADQKLMVDVASAYFDQLAARDAVRTLEGQMQAVERQLASARKNFSAGRGTSVDVRDAEARDDLVRADLVDARNRVEIAQSNLEQITGSATGTLAGLAPGLEAPRIDGGAADWTARALRNNLALRAARLRVDDARLATDAARAGGLPRVDAYARVEHASTSGGSTMFPFSTRADIASVGVQLEVPIFTGYAVSSDVDEKAAELERADAELDSARLAAMHDARSAWLSIDADRARLRALDAAVVSSSSALQATELGYRVGMKVSLDVLDAQSQLYDAERRATEARYASLVDGLRLGFAAGDLSDADLRAVDAELAR